MPSIKLKNASTVTIHDRRPGEEWTVQTDEDGIVLDERWRRRLKEEADFKMGHVVILPDALAVVVAVEAIEASAAPIAAESPTPPAPPVRRGKAVPSASQDPAPAEKE